MPARARENLREADPGAPRNCESQRASASRDLRGTSVKLGCRTATTPDKLAQSIPAAPSGFTRGEGTPPLPAVVSGGANALDGTAAHASSCSTTSDYSLFLTASAVAFSRVPFRIAVLLSLIHISE